MTDLHPPPSRFQPAVPPVPVKCCEAALRYDCDVLGFVKDYDDAILGRDVMLFCGVSRDTCALTLNQHDPQDYVLTIGIPVDDVDALYEEYRPRGVDIRVAPEDQPWGEWHMAIVDLDGHELHFSCPLDREPS